MKNSEEFRRAVYEKADAYRKKQAATWNRIGKTISLCSLCVVIGASAFFGIQRFGKDIFGPEQGDSNSGLSADTTPGYTLPSETTTGYKHPPQTTTGVFAETTSAIRTTERPAVTTTCAVETFATTIFADATGTIAVGTIADGTTERPAGLENEYAAVIEPMLVLSTGGVDEEAEQLLYMSHYAFLNALYARYEARLIGGEKEHDMLAEAFDDDFFRQNMLVAVYVRRDVTAYSFALSPHGMLSPFFDTEESDSADGDMMLHFYAVPWSHKFDQVLLSYGQ